MSKSAKGRVKCTPTKCRQYLRLILANVFSNVGLCGLVVGYAIIGALTFESLEANQESHMKEEIKQLREKCVQKLWNATLKYNVLFEPNWTREARETLKEFEQKVAGAAKTEGYDGKGTDKELQWSFSGALLYSVTVITTIGMFMICTTRVREGG